MRSFWFSAVFAISATAVGCLDDGKPDEEETDFLDDSKADSQLKPTNHGELAFATPAHSALTADARFHAWTFALSGNAQVDMTTAYSVLGQRRTDTVLYLYRQKDDGSWGAYISRNDDYGSTTYSQLKKSLGAGNYRVLVKGHLASTTGKFKVTVNCHGDGCAPPVTNTCIFGDSYHDIFENNPNIQVINSNKIYPNTLSTLNADDQHRLMLAVQQSSHDDVTTPEEAIMRVDQEEVNVTWLVEPAAKRSYIAFEYGAGDNSYGAVFDRYSAQMVTNIHDGDLEHCIATPKTCVFDDDWTAVRNNTADFTISSQTTITQASQLTGVAADQAMFAFRQSYDDVTSVADGLSRVDDNEIVVYQFKHKATNKLLEAFVYHAGDTAVGRIFFKGTTTRAAVINDLYIEGCDLFD